MNELLGFGYGALTQLGNPSLMMGARERGDFSPYTDRILTVPYEAQKQISPPVFTPADMHVVVRSPFGGMLTLGTLAMLTYSSHRDKYPVVSLGNRGVKGFTSGHRTVAGSLAFMSMDTDAFETLVNQYAQKVGWRGHSQSILADELPPFDVLVTLVNDLGDSSVFSIAGITLLDFGSTYQIDQIQTMETYSFLARSITNPRSIQVQAGGTPLEPTRTYSQYDPYGLNPIGFTSTFGSDYPLPADSLPDREIVAFVDPDSDPYTIDAEELG